MLFELLPRLLYVKQPAEGIEPRLTAMLDQIRSDATASYRSFTDANALAELVEQDLAALLSERFMTPAADPPPFPATAAPPVPLTPTVGREKDVARVVDLLHGEVRQVTVTGPGGIGKSRFALEVARSAAGQFTDGVVFVPLETITDPGMVLGAIAARLGVRDSGTRPVLDALVDELADRNPVPPTFGGGQRRRLPRRCGTPCCRRAGAQPRRAAARHRARRRADPAVASDGAAAPSRPPVRRPGSGAGDLPARQ